MGFKSRDRRTKAEILAENDCLISETHNWCDAYNKLKLQCERHERTIRKLQKVNGAQLQRLVQYLLLTEHLKSVHDVGESK